jgi:hypothetical protein
MTIRELIEELKKQPNQDAKVYVTSADNCAIDCSITVVTTDRHSPDCCDIFLDGAGG